LTARHAFRWSRIAKRLAEENGDVDQHERQIANENGVGLESSEATSAIARLTGRAYEGRPKPRIQLVGRTPLSSIVPISAIGCAFHGDCLSECEIIAKPAQVMPAFQKSENPLPVWKTKLSGMAAGQGK
jgi:hypothetical protein